MIKHKQGHKNIIVDALSRRHTFLVTLETKILGFDHIKELYQSDDDFSNLEKLFHECLQRVFHTHN